MLATGSGAGLQVVEVGKRNFSQENSIGFFPESPPPLNLR
jgi:hypothetical protein